MRSRGISWCLALLAGAGWPAMGSPGGAHEDVAALQASIRQALGVTLPAGEPVKCGLPLVTQAMLLGNAAPPGVREMLTRLLQRTEMQKHRTLGHFTVHYDTTGPDAASLLGPDHRALPDSSNTFADSVLATANQVYAYEVGTLGYAAPPDDGTAGGGPEYDIYVLNLGSQDYGSTEVETPLDDKSDGGRYTTYMRIHNNFSFVKPDSNVGMPALRVTIAHEFHHAIQLGQYGYWGNEIYFYELTAVWMETMAFPSVTDYLNYLRGPNGQFRNPNVSFTDHVTGIMYSRGIWGTFLAKKFTLAVMREIWEDIRTDSPLQANDAVLRRHGSSFRLAFAEWGLWNYFTGRRANPAAYYPNGSVYPAMAAVGIDFLPPLSQQSVDGTLPSLSSRYYEIATGRDTCSLVVTNLNDAAALNAVPPQYGYTVALNRSQPDAAYQAIGAAGYYRLTTADPANWKTWPIQGQAVVSAAANEGLAFPNPFRADGSSVVSLTGHGASAMVRVYDSSMRLVFESFESASRLPDKTVFQWNGRSNDGRLAASGVYFFTLELPDGTVTGKLALLRNGP